MSVTDHDYLELFKRKSPLDPAKLSELIIASAKSGAKVIGVDFDTSDWTEKERISTREQARMAAPQNKVRIVWAVDASVNEKTGNPEAYLLTGIDEKGHADCQALPAAVPDQNGIVRGFLPGISVTDNNQPIILPAMSTLIYSIYYDGLPDCSPPEALKSLREQYPHFVNFSGGQADFQNLPASLVLEASKGAAWINSNPLSGRIVLIGGDYREARDRYATPVGYLTGVDILAQTVLSNKRGVLRASKGWFIAIDVLVGMSLLTATWFLHRAWVLVLSFILIPVVALAGSYIAFARFNYFASFMPVVVGVFLHHLVEHAIEHWRLTQEVRKLRAIVRSHAEGA